MHGAFLQDLAVVMLVAGLVTALFHRLKQPVVLGYILAGIVVGPYTTKIPLAVHDRETVEIMAELGVILLMFGLGLHFSIRRLAKVGWTALLAATMEILLMVGLGYFIGKVFGWKPMDCLFLGAILSISSTTIIVKALGELRLTKEPFAELIFGILIVEDILAIAMIALLSSIASTGTLALAAVVVTLIKLAIFLTAVLVVGLLAVPAMLRYVNRFKSDETLLIVSLAICFGVSLLAMRLGYSVALGAFLAGAVVAEARERGRIDTLVAPVRDMFSAVFFVAIGMLIDPDTLLHYIWPIVVIALAVIVGKVLTCALGTFLAGNTPRTSLRVGMGLAQIGEFSFIIAALGQNDLKATSSFLYPIAVMVSVITTLVTPYLINSSDTLSRQLGRLAPRPLVEATLAYEAWVSSPSSTGGHQRARRLLRKWLLQVLLNLALVTAIFITAAAASRVWPDFASALPKWIGRGRGMFWLIAMVLSLPLVIATLRKLRVAAMFLAELIVVVQPNAEKTQTMRRAVGTTVFIVAAALVVGLVLVLGSVILPPSAILSLLIAVVVVIAVIARPTLNRIYAAAQISLQETLSAPPQPDHDDSAELLQALGDAELRNVSISADSPGAGKLLRELQLRSQTGASAVAIERAGQRIANPGPDEELLAGDRVLLLGTAPQVSRAMSLLNHAIVRTTTGLVSESPDALNATTRNE